MSTRMNIGEAARAAGITAKMARHYEQMGLVEAAARSDSGYRQYGERDVAVLRFVRQARSLGFALPRIAELLGLWSDRQRSSREVKALASEHLAALDQRLQELTAMRDALHHLVTDCAGGDDPQCAILQRLGEPASAPVAPPAARAPRRRPARGEPATGGAPVHAELMAWARQARSASELG